MRALTLWQPWASAIAAGLKKVETRGWPAPEWAMGRIAIHASKRWTADEQIFLHNAITAGDPRNAEAFLKLHGERPMPLGAVVATAELYGCRYTQDLTGAGVIEQLEEAWGNFTPGRWGWCCATCGR